MNVEPEMEFGPEVEFRQEMDIPAETCEGGLGAARPELVMGWVHPWVGLGWVGSEFFFNFWWVGLDGDLTALYF